MDVPTRGPAAAALVALGCALALAAPARADHPCPGLPVARVDLVGCDAGVCRSHEAMRRLVDTLPLAPDGDAVPLPEAELARVAGTLLAANLVAAPPTWTCDDERQALLLTVVPQAFVRKVTLLGNDFFRKKDLLKRVFLRPGTPLTLDPTAPANADITRQVDSLLRLYRQAGLDAARIDVVTHIASPTEIDLDFVISEGSRSRIDTVVARHVRPAPDDRGELRCPTITERRLERLTGLEAGDVVTRLTERQVKEKLRRAFQAAGWERPRIDVAPDPEDPGRLEVVVSTDHCWIVRVWERDLAAAPTEGALSFRWTDPLHDGGDAPAAEASFRRAELDDWSGVLPFGESGSFDADEAARGVAAMAREVRARGYPFAEVTMSHRELERGGEALGVIDYFVTLNLPRRVAAIRFEGNRGFDDEALAERMKSKAYDFFGSPGAFDEARAFADLVELRRFYIDRGFLQMRYVDAAPTPDAPLSREVLTETERQVVWRYRASDLGFRVSQNLSELHLTLHVAIDEGPRTRVRRLDVSGASLLSPARVATLTRLGPGRPFGKQPLEDARAALLRHYQQRGHHRFRLDVTCRVGEPAETVPCDADALRGRGDVDVALTLAEGPPITVGAIVWRGNAETDPHVLVRDLPQVGELLDLDKVNLAVRRMRALGIYNSVRVDVIGLEDGGQADPLGDDPTTSEARAVTLVVAVEETGYRFLDIAGGIRSIQRSNIGRVPRWAANSAGTLVDQADRVSTGFGRAFALDIPDILFTVEVEYLDLDVAQIGDQLRIPFTVGFSLSQFLRLATFDPSLTFPRIFDSTVTLTTRIIAEMDQVTDPLDRLEIGAEADVSVPLSDTMLAGITARAGVIQLETPGDACVYCLSGPPIGWSTALPQDLGDEAATLASCGGDEDAPACDDTAFRPQLTLTLRWRWDRQDTPLHPTRGTVLAASTSFILDRDRESSSPEFNQFVKWEASVRGAVPLGPMVLAGFVRYGAAATFGERFLPLDERYTLGGSNGLRGFVDNGVCRYNRDKSLKDDCDEEFGGNVLFNGSLELRAPLIESIGLWLGAFLDTGALAERHEEVYWASFRWGAGVGLRFLLGGLFPVRLDFGFPVFERRCVAVTSDGTCIKEDLNQVHFDLLYTF